MTLTHIRTETTAQCLSAGQDHRVSLEGLPLDRHKGPGRKVFEHLDRLQAHLNTDVCLDIHTRNFMPKGCGLASSASGLCALTLAALGAWMQASDFERLSQLGYSKQQLAYWARLGSGSAGRSMWGGFVSWDKTLSPETQTITPLWEAEHWDLWDMVLLMSHQEKPVSSTEAHAYAHTSPLFPIRLAHITHREADIKDALAQKHFDRLGAYIEQESLDMHAVIMTAKPPVYYWSPLVPEVLSWIRKERTQGRLPAYFTMDAGPNIHVLCQGSDKDYVAAALKKAWPHWELLIDSVGTGPTLTCLSR